MAPPPARALAAEPDFSTEFTRAPTPAAEEAPLSSGLYLEVGAGLGGQYGTANATFDERSADGLYARRGDLQMTQSGALRLFDATVAWRVDRLALGLTALRGSSDARTSAAMDLGAVGLRSTKGSRLVAVGPSLVATGFRSPVFEVRLGCMLAQIAAVVRRPLPRLPGIR